MTRLTEMMARLPRLDPGHVWLAGAGPGDPGLLTLAAAAALDQAEVVVHDALVDHRILALAGPRAVLEFAGKRGGRPSATQPDVTARLLLHARAGRRVLRLKGGDPFVFGRGAEEMLALAAAGVPFRVLPAATSALAGLATALIPATMRGINQAVILVTGHGAGTCEGPDWAALARTGQPILVYMGMTRLAAIAAALQAGGLPGETPAAIVSWGTTERQRVLVATLADIASTAAAQGFASPAIVAVGHIASVRAQVLALTEPAT